MKIYLDLYFLINFEVDFLLLCLVGRLLHMKCSLLRCILAACAGGMIACGGLLVPQVVFHLLLLFLGAVLMLYIAFGKAPFCTVKEAARGLLLFFGASFLIGGVFEALLPRVLNVLSPRLLFLFSAIVIFSALWILDVFSLSQSLRPITVSFVENQRSVSLRLLSDSGCLLHEPISGMPVILLSARRFDALFPHDVLHEPENASRYHLRYVPIQTACGHGAIPAVCPQELVYRTENGSPQICRALLGRAENESFAGFDGVFPTALLQFVER